MSTFELIRDLYKDARGVRPSSGWMEVFDGLTDVAQAKTWDDLCHEMNDRDQYEGRQEIAAQREYELRIGGMVHDYNVDRATAIRWDAESFELDTLSATQNYGTATQEIEFFLYNQGIASRLYPMYVAEIDAALTT